MILLNSLRTLLELIKFPISFIWIVEIILVLFLTITTVYLFRRFYVLAHRRLRKTKNSWDSAVALALKKPIVIAIWLIGFMYIVRIITEQTNIHIFNKIAEMKTTVVSIGIVWASFRFINHMTRLIVVRNRRIGRPVDLTTADAISKMIKAIFVIAVILIIMDYMGVSLKGLLAFGGVSGIAIGFAAKDLLANIFGALVLYMDKPLAVGDWVRSPDKEIEGVVEYIGWRLTRIRRFNKRPIYVPNSVLGNIIIENPSRMTSRRIDETIGVRYEDIDKINKITGDVKDMLIRHPDIRSSQTLFVNFDQFGGYSLNIRVYTFTRTIEWMKFQEVKQDVFLKIVEIIEQNGAKLALPHSVVEVKDGIDFDINKGNNEPIELHYHEENGHAH